MGLTHSFLLLFSEKYIIGHCVLQSSTILRLFLKRLIYLKIRVTEREKLRSFFCWFTSNIAIIARAWPGQNQEPEVPLSSAMCVGHLLLPVQVHSWTGNAAGGSQTGAPMGSWYHRKWLNSLLHNTRHRDSIYLSITCYQVPSVVFCPHSQSWVITSPHSHLDQHFLRVQE